MRAWPLGARIPHQSDTARHSARPTANWRRSSPDPELHLWRYFTRIAREYSERRSHRFQLWFTWWSPLNRGTTVSDATMLDATETSLNNSRIIRQYR